MRILVTSLFFLLCLGQFIRAQSSLPFPRTNAVWYHGLVGWGQMLPQGSIGTMGDTLIKGDTCTKLGYSGDTLFNPSTAIYETAVRTVGDQWFFIMVGDTLEYLLYDFSLQKGDTITLNNTWSSSYDPLVVLDVDTVVIGVPRKRLFLRVLNSAWEEYWIEGIGSTNGILYSGWQIADAQNILLCHQKDNIILYFDPVYGACYTPKVDREPSSDDLSIEVFPNPALAFCIFRMNRAPAAGLFFQFFNANGKLIRSRQVNETEFRLETNGLPLGIYFYRLEIPGKPALSGKLIVE